MGVSISLASANRSCITSVNRNLFINYSRLLIYGRIVFEDYFLPLLRGSVHSFGLCY